MENIQNNLSLFVEEKQIYQEQEILNKQKVIPQDFVELTTTHGKNYMCSTGSWKEPVCERYCFIYEGKWIQLDIPKELMKKLDLEPGENCLELVFVSPEVLKREPECGGITLQSEEEIFFASPGNKVVREKGVQTKVRDESISELGTRIGELEKMNKALKEENGEKDWEVKKLKDELKMVEQKAKDYAIRIVRAKKRLEVAEERLRLTENILRRQSRKEEWEKIKIKIEKQLKAIEEEEKN